VEQPETTTRPDAAEMITPPEAGEMTTPPEAGGTTPRPEAGETTLARLARLGRLLGRDRVAGIASVVAVAALVIAAVGFGGGAHAVLPSLRDVGAWLTNDGTGSVSHANGLSGKVDSRVTLSNAQGHQLEVIQDGSTVLVRDLTTGVISRIDPAQLTVTQSVSYGSPGVTVVAGSGLAYVIDPAKGLVQRIDPVRLSVVGPPIALPPPLGTAGIDARGTLWVPTPATGSVVPVYTAAGGPTAGAVGTADTAAATAGAPVAIGAKGDPLLLTIAGGTPVVTDPDHATMTVLSVAGGRSTVNLPSPSAGADALAPPATDGPVVPVVLGSDQLLVVDTSTGTPTSVTLTGLDAGDAATAHPSPGQHRLGAPQVVGGRVYIPDSTTGRLIVYDIASGRLLDQIQVSSTPGPLQMFVKDGLLWVNSAQGPDAVSIDATGAVHHIGKYEPTLPGGPLPTPSPRGGPGNGNGDRQGNGGGGSSPPAPRPSTSTTSPPPPPVLNPPESVSQKPQPGSIRVTFSPVSGAAPQRYTLTDVPAGAQIDPPEIKPGQPYEFTVTGLDCAQTYQFTVVAHYPTGTTSAKAGAASRPCVAPDPPTKVRLATTTQRQLGVSWTPPASDGGGTVHFDLSWGVSSISDLTGTSHTITGLNNFATYTVSVAAVNFAGSSEPPSTVSGMIAPGTTWGGTITNNWLLPLNVRKGPDTSTQSIGSFPAGGGEHVDIICSTNGGHWADPSGNPSGNGWYKITSPAGYVAAGYVSTGSGIWTC
jgi:hypothetical protein